MKSLTEVEQWLQTIVKGSFEKKSYLKRYHPKFYVYTEVYETSPFLSGITSMTEGFSANNKELSSESVVVTFST